VRGAAIVLATGCRERPRAARLIPGARPLGVFTTGALQQLVHVEKQRIARRAVVVGAEHVSFSAVLTLARGGAATAAIVTEQPRHQSVGALAWATAGWRRIPILTDTIVSRIVGRGRVEGVEVTNVVSGATRAIDCDAVVFTGDWIPDHELARTGGLVVDATRGPRIDPALRTSKVGVFAAGNLIHAAEAGDVAALSGRHAAAAVAAFLRDGAWPATPPVPIVCRPPLRWISPGAVDGDGRPPRDRFVMRVDACIDDAHLEVTQGGRSLWHARYRALVPGRSIAVDASWIGAVDRGGSEITVAVDRQ
jgi:pyruvate/2-oxoglutarate dehydrogenase complex dihydrolipoamide dehydrogenase (E3) component